MYSTPKATTAGKTPLSPNGATAGPVPFGKRVAKETSPVVPQQQRQSAPPPAAKSIASSPTSSPVTQDGSISPTKKATAPAEVGGKSLPAMPKIALEDLEEDSSDDDVMLQKKALPKVTPDVVNQAVPDVKTAAHLASLNEAQNSARLRLQDLLKHPDDLMLLERKSSGSEESKGPPRPAIADPSSLFSKFYAERKSREAQLKTAVQSELNDSQEALFLLQRTTDDLLTVRNDLLSVERNCEGAKDVIQNYPKIKKVSSHL